MASLADTIERYLKALLAQSSDGSVDLQRAQLAEHFACAPSQINYVLSTRFLLEHGYHVETRRGGGGYIRITRLPISSRQDFRKVVEAIDEAISQRNAEAILEWLLRDGAINEREAMIMQAALQRDVLSTDLPWRDVLRARILKSMLLAAYRHS